MERRQQPGQRGAARRSARRGAHAAARFALAGLVAWAASSAGCAPTSPLLTGATATPARRGDVLVGGAFRQPVGPMRRAVRTPDSPSRAALTLAAREGAAPVGVVRYGLGERRDVGVGLTGTSAELSFRQAVPLDDAGRGHVVFGVSPVVRWRVDPGSEVADPASAGGRTSGVGFGAQLPILLTRTFSGVYDLWGGLRLAVEGARGRVDGERTGAMVYRAGAVFGLGIGLKTLAVLVEIAADYEQVDFEREGVASVSDLILTPAFALRVRL